MTLPPPDPAFHWSAEPWGHALRCRPLAAIAQHAFTSKQLQLRLGADGSDDSYFLAWTQAASSVGAGLEQIRRVRQVHGNGVRVLKQGESGPDDASVKPDADAMVSNATGLVLTVQIADCVPILLADAKAKTVAAIHAGWRGTAARVVQSAITAMTDAFQTNPSDLIAAIGPSIGPCCYQVGASVVAAFRETGVSEEQLQHWFSEELGVIRFDLWRANRDQLEHAGIPSKQIYACGLCTMTYRDVFESYRVAGERAGRMAGLIRVP